MSLCVQATFPKGTQRDGEKSSRDERGAGRSTLSLFEFSLSRETFHLCYILHFILLNILTSKK